MIHHKFLRVIIQSLFDSSCWNRLAIIIEGQSMAGHGDGDNFEMPSLDSQSLRDDGQSQQISASAISPSSPLITRPAEPQQFIKLFFPMGWTISFTIALVIVIKVYEGKGILTPSQKNAFNFITTGLILFLGLSFYVRGNWRAQIDMCSS